VSSAFSLEICGSWKSLRAVVVAVAISEYLESSVAYFE
jgi:hypothetical protein